MSVLGAGEAFMLASGEDAGFKIERSLRFDREAGSNLSKTFSSTGNTKKFTWSFWFKGCDSGTGASPFLIGVETNNANRGGLYYSVESLRFYSRVSDTTHFDIVTQPVYRDPSAWYHCVMAVDVDKSFANGGFKIYINGVDQPLTANLYTQGQALHWNTASAHAIGIRPGYTDRYYSGYMADIHFVDGQQLDPDGVFGEFDADTGVWNAIKYTGTYGTNGFHLDFSDNSSKDALGTDSSGNSNTWDVYNINTTALSYGRLATSSSDAPSSPQGGVTYTTASNRITNPSDNSGESDFQNTRVVGFQNITGVTSLEVLRVAGTSSAKLGFNGGLSTVGSHGSYSYPATRSQAAWYTVSNPPSTITSMAIAGGGSGASNQHAVFAIKVNGVELSDLSDSDIDSVVDSPTNYEASSGNNGGNYATFNPLDSENGTLSNGNLTTNQTNTSVSFGPQNTTIGVSSGKWYCEIKFDSGTYALVGITHEGSVGKSGTTWHRDAATYTWYFSGAFMSIAWPGTSTFPDGSNPTFTVGDVVGVLLDKDNDKLYFTKNGSYVASMNAATGANGIDISAHSGKTAFITCGNNASTATQLTLNAGQRPFAASSIPTGYKSLCTQNFDDPLIARGSQYFDVKLYSGNNGTQSITGLNFSPDITWLNRYSANTSHFIYDRIRGEGATAELVPSNTYAEGSVTDVNAAAFGYLHSFDANGFTVKAGTTNGVYANATGGSYVSWNWDVGSSNTSFSVGSLNSSTYDQSQTWSNGTQSNADTNRPLTNLFDNSTSTLIAAPSGSNSSNKITLPVSITAQSSVRYYSMAGGYNNGPTTLSNSGTTVSTIPAENNQTTGWKSFSGSFPMTFNEFTVQRSADAGGTGSGAALFEVDGKILVDNGVTVTNVPAIASTCRANQAAGVSIVSYQGNGGSDVSVAHGLNTSPVLLILKDRDASLDWDVTFTFVDGSYDFLKLNAISTKLDITGRSAPTSSVIHVNGGLSNVSGRDYICYCFAPVEGYSAMGTWVGNSSTAPDQPFIYCGFRPRFILWKKYAGQTDNWFIWDTARDPYNRAENFITPNTSTAQNNDPYNKVDILSNGFKMRVDNAAYGSNTSHSFLFYAVAENPFQVNGGLAR